MSTKRHIWIIILSVLLIGIQSAFGQTWVQKVPGGGLGNPLAYNPLNTNYMYGSPASSRIYVSRNRGYTWLSLGNQIQGGGIIKSICIDPLDTLQILAGVEMGSSSPDRIMKSTDGGFTWVFTWGGTFSYYGQPLEHKAMYGETVFTMGNDTIWKSTNFGTTWDTVTKVSGFTTWCDMERRPDSLNVMYIGDASSGIWKTTDSGVNWKKTYVTSGEIPSIAVDPLNPQVAYATKYAGGGGVLKTTDWGESWFSLTTPIGTGSTWWVVCSPTAPNYVYFGTYGSSPFGIYLSRDGGNSWVNFQDGLSGILNYGLMTLDTLSVIAAQNNGLYKLQYPTGIHIASPNGGESYPAGSMQKISWSDSGIVSMKLEYSTNGGSNWVLIANNVSYTQTSYNWTLPVVESNSCRIRISDELNPSILDTSDANFSIVSVLTNLTSPNGGEQWNVGTTQNITWTAIGPSNINIYYSTNNGGSWNFVAKRPASSSLYPWSIPNTPSALCRVRIRSDFDSTKSDVSDTTFGIINENEFVSDIIFIQGETVLDTLHFGVLAGATDAIDPSFNETELAPKPGIDTMDIRWAISGTNGTKRDIRDTVTAYNQERRFTAELQAGSGGYPITLSWNPQIFDSGELILRDTTTHGSLFTVNMKNDSSYMMLDTSVKAFEIVYAKAMTNTIGSSGGWHLMSLPVRVVDQTVAYNFPLATSPAYAYASSYVQKDTLLYGVGYWVKSDPVSITGQPFDLDTIDMRKGWNMIGSLSYPLSTSFITTIPDSLIASNFWEYVSGVGYQSASTIMPGEGYWVKSKAVGQFILSLPFASFAKAEKADVVQKLNSLTVSDGNGNRQSLYFGRAQEGIDPDFYEMPPVFSENSFDVRFKSQRMVEVFDENKRNLPEFGISLNSKKMPIIFSWRVDNYEKINYILVETIGNKIVSETPLQHSGRLIMNDIGMSAFAIRGSQAGAGSEIPQEFQLGLNYPNPFNPTTRISYSLPSSAQLSIKVFSVLGQEVAALYTGEQSAGIYNVEWNGTSSSGISVSSGVYYVRMTARSIDTPTASSAVEYAGTRKIILMK